MQWEFIVALVIAIGVILFPAAFIWYLNVTGIYGALREARRRQAARGHIEGKPRALATVSKRISTMVLAIGKLTIRRPSGVVLGVVMVLGVFGFLVWFLVASFGGSVVLLALGSVIAILLVSGLVAFAWYMNVSGLYQVIRDTWQKRARERRLARMLRKAMVQMLTETLIEERPSATEAVTQERVTE